MIGRGNWIIQAVESIHPRRRNAYMFITQRMASIWEHSRGAMRMVQGKLQPEGFEARGFSMRLISNRFWGYGSENTCHFFPIFLDGISLSECYASCIVKEQVT